MRIGEAIAMDKDDIDWENKEAIVVNVKSKEPQKVFFTDRSLHWLKRYLARPGRQAIRPSSSQDGTRLGREVSRSRMHRQIERIAAVARDQKEDNAPHLQEDLRDASPSAEGGHHGREGFGEAQERTDDPARIMRAWTRSVRRPSTRTS